MRNLDGASEVAFEAFFGSAFFGIRCRSGQANVDQFALCCLRAFSNACDGSKFFELLGRCEGCYRLGQTPRFAEVGAVNAWQSVAAVRINGIVDAARDADWVWGQLEGSAVERDQARPKAIEFSFHGTLEHWFGLPVSRQRPPCVILRPMVDAALAAFVAAMEA
jgi:hypothetical protein